MFNPIQIGFSITMYQALTRLAGDGGPSPGMTDRESGVWVSTTSPLDPKEMTEKFQVTYKYYEL